MFNAVDAQLASVSLHHEALAWQFNERRVIDTDLNQRFRKFCTDARGGGILVDAMLRYPEPVFADRLIEGGGNIVAGLNILSQSQRRNHIAPAPDLLHRFCHDLQRAHLRGRGHGAQIRIARRAHRALAIVAVFRTVLAFYFKRETRIFRPHIARVALRRCRALPVHRAQ